MVGGSQRMSRISRRFARKGVPRGIRQPDQYADEALVHGPGSSGEGASCQRPAYPGAATRCDRARTNVTAPIPGSCHDAASSPYNDDGEVDAGESHLDCAGVLARAKAGRFEPSASRRDVCEPYRLYVEADGYSWRVHSLGDCLGQSRGDEHVTAKVRSIPE